MENVASVNDESRMDFAHYTFRYGHQNVLENISIKVEKGSFLGLVGPNGSGKSTLIKLVLGLLKTDVGTIRLIVYLFVLILVIHMMLGMMLEEILTKS